ncbi:hypothetical protein [Pelomonas sp. SE-A7]|uniref:hypothetical protein n=1 Tax=Pelomonas sp. SE-A7 TaxID=3054953 RepID=UPI00259D2274|nr:hypothetical protein [Pelomonas sp. SE-A7]MDM4768064.1 hypothetical protein [Pelomonas sp. SE-A7]
MAKTMIPLLAAAALVVAAFATNPSPDQHREKIKQAVSERSQMDKVLGVGHLTAFASKYHSLGLASYSTVSDKLVSFGVLGMVFVRD